MTTAEGLLWGLAVGVLALAISELLKRRAEHRSELYTWAILILAQAQIEAAKRRDRTK